MTVTDIKKAVDEGVTVFWKNRGYSVIKDSLGQYLIGHDRGGDYIGLTHNDGVTLNGHEQDFWAA